MIGQKEGLELERHAARRGKSPHPRLDHPNDTRAVAVSSVASDEGE
jgi:hypothetical protein